MSSRRCAGTRVDWQQLATTAAVRERCGQLLTLAEAGGTHFAVVPEREEEVVRRVADVTRDTYPDLRIPFHSRWGHFQAGGVDRLAALRTRLSEVDVAERTRTLFDLVIVSVLLDAGTGPGWRFHDAATSQSLARSEGLAVASLRLFQEGGFSSDRARPWQTDADGLRALSADRLGAAFQVSEQNPLVGLEGRVSLLHRLAAAIEADPRHFPGLPARPGNLADACGARARGGKLPARDLFGAVLAGLASIWPAGLVIEGPARGESWPLGDVWPHPALGSPGSTASLVPFHKLSQWLTYSLVEPLEEAGLEVTEFDDLTALAEYRNGGLLLDAGLMRLRDPRYQERSYAPGDPLVVEWRALTVALIDRLAGPLRVRLGGRAEDLPLVRLLEGGTWRAGRRIAAELRPGGAPPLVINSDGTVF